MTNNQIGVCVIIHQEMDACAYQKISEETLSPLFPALSVFRLGVKPGVFQRGLTRPRRGVKYGLQGTINAKNLRKNNFSPSDEGASMFREIAIDVGAVKVFQ